MKNRWIGTSLVAFFSKNSSQIFLYAISFCYYKLKAEEYSFRDTFIHWFFIYSDSNMFSNTWLQHCILISKSSHYMKYSKKQFWKFLYIFLIHSKKVCTMIIIFHGHKNRSAVKVNLSVLHGMFWKLFEVVLTTPIFLERYIWKTS